MKGEAEILIAAKNTVDRKLTQLKLAMRTISGQLILNIRGLRAELDELRSESLHFASLVSADSTRLSTQVLYSLYHAI